MWTYLSDLHEITLALSWRQLVATELKKYNYSFFKIINGTFYNALFLQNNPLHPFFDSFPLNSTQATWSPTLGDVDKPTIWLENDRCVWIGAIHRP